MHKHFYASVQRGTRWEGSSLVLEVLHISWTSSWKKRTLLWLQPMDCTVLSLVSSLLLWRLVPKQGFYLLFKSPNVLIFCNVSFLKRSNFFLTKNWNVFQFQRGSFNLFQSLCNSASQERLLGRLHWNSMSKQYGKSHIHSALGITGLPEQENAHDRYAALPSMGWISPSGKASKSLLLHQEEKLKYFNSSNRGFDFDLDDRFQLLYVYAHSHTITTSTVLYRGLDYQSLLLLTYLTKLVAAASERVNCAHW